MTSTKFKYAFNLGRVFALSLAELFAVFETMGLDFRVVDLYREILIIETETELEVAGLQRRLGGTIKIMGILDSLGRKKQAGPAEVFKDYFDARLLKEKFLTGGRNGKTQIGVSIYPMARPLPLFGQVKRIGLALKDILTASGVSVRIVLPQHEAISLPSVVVTNEHLLEKGAEIVFLVAMERIYLAKTLVVQDFEDYGRRDYQRPARDNQVGMLPPKVAQIMINLARLPKKSQADGKSAVLDPFVGSGTVLQEAMIMGYKVLGSDISEKSVEKAERNLLWIKNRYKIAPNRFELFASDVKDLKNTLPNLEILGVVTEGTLGPGLSEAPGPNQIQKNFSDLEKVYLNAFKTFKQILKPQTPIIIALPAYRLVNRYEFFNIVDRIEKLGYYAVNPLPDALFENFEFLRNTVTPRKSIIYDRKDQFVSREIFIFKSHGTQESGW